MKWSWALVLVAMSAGCQNQKPQDPAARAVSPAVLDVSAPAPGAYPAPASAAPAYVPPAAPEPIASPAPVAQVQMASSPLAATGSRYTVKKGDTLFHIAREHYGDGKRWQQIAAANPGVSPNTLKVGQTLVMPQ